MPGKASNDLRMRFGIPLIDSNLVSNDTISTVYSRWFSVNEFPAGNEVLHTWKTISTTSGSSIITTEDDAFRKRINDSLFYQLDINSVLGIDSSLATTGTIFEVTKNENTSGSKKTDKQYKQLDKPGIDSVMKSWKTY